MMFSVLASFVILAGAQSYAGDEKRDGGVVVACEQKGHTTYELMDLMEASAVHDFTLQLETGKNHEEIFEKMMKRLEVINPSRASLYRLYMSRWNAEAKEISDMDFSETNDEGWHVLPAGCKRLQAVVQTRRATVSGIRYYVNKNVWDRLSDSNKAALLVHEFMYREGALPQNDFANSAGLRYLNAYLHSDAFSKGTLENYYQAVSFAGYDTLDVGNIPVTLHVRSSGVKVEKPMTFENGQLKSAYAREYAFVRRNQLTPLRCSGLDSTLFLSFSGRATPSQIEAPCLMKLILADEGYVGTVHADVANFNEQGQLTLLRASPMRESVQVLKITGMNFHLERGLGKQSGTFWMQFYPSGQVESLHMGLNPRDLAKSFFRQNGEVFYLSNPIFDSVQALEFTEDGMMLPPSR